MASYFPPRVYPGVFNVIGFREYLIDVLDRNTNEDSLWNKKIPKTLKNTFVRYTSVALPFFKYASLPYFATVSNVAISVAMATNLAWLHKKEIQKENPSLDKIKRIKLQALKVLPFIAMAASDVYLSKYYNLKTCDTIAFSYAIIWGIADLTGKTQKLNEITFGSYNKLYDFCASSPKKTKNAVFKTINNVKDFNSNMFEKISNKLSFRSGLVSDLVGKTQKLNEITFDSYKKLYDFCASSPKKTKDAVFKTINNIKNFSSNMFEKISNKFSYKSKVGSESLSTHMRPAANWDGVDIEEESDVESDDYDSSIDEEIDRIFKKNCHEDNKYAKAFKEYQKKELANGYENREVGRADVIPRNSDRYETMEADSSDEGFFSGFLRRFSQPSRPSNYNSSLNDDLEDFDYYNGSDNDDLEKEYATESIESSVAKKQTKEMQFIEDTRKKLSPLDPNARKTRNGITLRHSTLLQKK